LCKTKPQAKQYEGTETAVHHVSFQVLNWNRKER
jgi:hypothetical protein